MRTSTQCTRRTANKESADLPISKVEWHLDGTVDRPSARDLTPLALTAVPTLDSDSTAADGQATVEGDATAGADRTLAAARWDAARGETIVAPCVAQPLNN